MEKELLCKVARYVELSTKFSKNESDIFTQEELSGSYNPNGYGTVINGSGNIMMGSSDCFSVNFGGTVILDGKEIYVDEKTGQVKAKDPKKPLTRGEQLQAAAMAKAEGRAKLLDEYDEYLRLRTQLKGYIRGVEELTKGDGE